MVELERFNEPLQRGFGRIRFGRFFGAARAATKFFAAEEDAGTIDAVVVGSLRRELFVGGHFAAMVLLRPLLQFPFGVLAASGQFDRIDLVAEEGKDGVASSFQPTIEVDCADKGFEGVFEHGLARFGVVLVVGIADFEVFAEILAHSHAGEGFAVDDASAAAIERALVGLGEFGIEGICYDEVEHGVAEELEALIIAARTVATGVGEGELEQGLVLKVMIRNRFVRHF